MFPYLQEKEIEEEDDDDTIVIFISSQLKRTKIFQKKEEKVGAYLLPPR
jgi:hypothetical protein